MNTILNDIILPLALAVLVALLVRILWRMRKRELAALLAHSHAASPENTLEAFVDGASIPAMREAALERGRALYGPGARLAVIAVSNIRSHRDGEFRAAVVVRNCYVPAAQPEQPKRRRFVRQPA